MIHRPINLAVDNVVAVSAVEAVAGVMFAVPSKLVPPIVLGFLMR